MGNHGMTVPLVLFLLFCSCQLRPVSVTKEELKKEHDLLQRLYSSSNSNSLDFQYHHYNEMTQFLQLTAEKYPNNSRLYSIGQSVDGRELWMMEVSNDFSLPYPGVFLSGNMHGDETVGREILLHLVDFVLTEGNLPNVLLAVMPTMNPDGFEADKRENSKGKDLNRDFPSRFSASPFSTSEKQPETSAVMNWLKENEGRMSTTANFHGGALVCNYPWDALHCPSSKVRQYAATKEDSAFMKLCRSYADAHELMRDSATFPHGITNGGAWYPVCGSLQDWAFTFTGMMSVTLEVSGVKYPAASNLAGFWEINKPALTAFLNRCSSGVTGTLVDAVSGKVVSKCSFSVAGGSGVSSENGYFHRFVLAGSQSVTFSKPGYELKSVGFTAVDGMLVDAGKILLYHSGNDTSDDDSSTGDDWVGSDSFVAMCVIVSVFVIGTPVICTLMRKRKRFQKKQKVEFTVLEEIEHGFEIEENEDLMELIPEI